jgi:hypothetical protein
MMTKYLAGVLTVIAVGTLLIAYGLLGPRASASDAFIGRPMTGSDRVTVLDNGAAGYGANFAAGYPAAQRVAYPVGEVRTAPLEPAPRRAVATRPVRYEEAPVRRVERERRRDWTRTAMIIGGSSAAGAGLGAIIGGKKGALIGAALGGGASTIYEVRKR